MVRAAVFVGKNSLARGVLVDEHVVWFCMWSVLERMCMVTVVVQYEAVELWYDGLGEPVWEWRGEQRIVGCQR